jgi:uncharacterized protein
LDARPAKVFITTPENTREAQRFVAIDLSRGIALLGVALVNVHAIARGWSSHYALDLASHPGDVIAEYIVGLVFAHRAFPMLAFLLGVGIAMQWRKLANDAESSRALSALRARYVALLILGVAHALLLWPGDIVSTYALIVLIILWRWPKSDGRLKFWALFAGGLSVLTYVSIALTYFAAVGEFSDIEPLKPTTSSFAQTTLSAALTMHAKEYLASGIVQALLPEVWAAILLGMWLGQSERFEHWLRAETQAKGWFAFGLVLLAVGTALEFTASRMGAWQYEPAYGVGDGLLILGIPFVLIGSVFAWLALARAWRDDVLPDVRSLLIAAGQTPLTQFFGQSFVFFVVFSDSLIGWHGDLGRSAYALTAIVTFVLLAGFARAWLGSGYARGPAEIAWMALAKRLARDGTRAARTNDA